MKAVEALAFVGGHVDEELLKRNEYLAAENEILRSKIEGRVRFTDAERIRLATLRIDSHRSSSGSLRHIRSASVRPRARPSRVV